MAKINIQDTSHNLLKIAISSFDNQLSQRIVSIADTYMGDSDFNLDIIGDNLIFKSNNFYSNGRLIALPLKVEFNLNYVSEGKLQALIPGDVLTNRKMEFQLYSKKQMVWSQIIEIARIFPNEETSVSWLDSSFSIKTGKSAFLDTTLLTVSCHSADSLDRILPLASSIFEIYPADVPLFNDIIVKIVPDSLPSWGKWTIFKTDGKETLSYLNSTFTNDSTALQAETKTLGNFVIACDTISPYLDIHSPIAGMSYKNNPDIILDLYDGQAGIGKEENISILIDGEFILPEWDPEEKSVIAHIDRILTKGNHTLTVSITDLCGNIKRRAVYFSIQ